MTNSTYENIRRFVCEGGAQFVPVCPHCARFVRVATAIQFDSQGQPKGTNATCKRCGPVAMPFEGYY